MSEIIDPKTNRPVNSPQVTDEIKAIIQHLYANQNSLNQKIENLKPAMMHLGMFLEFLIEELEKNDILKINIEEFAAFAIDREKQIREEAQSMLDKANQTKTDIEEIIDLTDE